MIHHNNSLRSTSINPPNNRDVSQNVLHLWSKFDDYSLSIKVSTNSNWGKFGILSQLLPWKSILIAPPPQKKKVW